MIRGYMVEQLVEVLQTAERVGIVTFNALEWHTAKPLMRSPRFLVMRSKRGEAEAMATAQALHEAGCDLVFVLGDPQYYGRFGFQQADQAMFPTPQMIPEEYEKAFRQYFENTER